MSHLLFSYPFGTEYANFQQKYRRIQTVECLKHWPFFVIRILV